MLLVVPVASDHQAYKCFMDHPANCMTLRSAANIAGKNIAAPVETMPDTWIIHTCPLCGERRRYLPAEIFRGRLSHQFEKLGTPREA